MNVARVLASAAFAAASTANLCAAERDAGADAAARVLAEQVCVICHGPGGHSTSPETPSLAAQPYPYLAAKIEWLRNRALAAAADRHVELLGLSLLDDSMVAALARYFANQSAPAAVAGDAALVSQGEAIYNRGVPEQKLAPCGVCHGVDAQGLWIFPRLAGQHAAYVEFQLNKIQQRTRKARVMHGVIQSMTPQEIKAVAAYVQSK